MKTRNIAIPAAYILLERDGKFLIAKRANIGYEAGRYNLPAGHVEKGELPSEAIIREAKEEIGIDLSPEEIKLFHISYRPKHDDTDNRVDFFFHAKEWGGEIQNMEPNKCDELKWAALDELPENMSVHVRVALDAFQKGELYKEIDIPYLKSKGVYKI